MFIFITIFSALALILGLSWYEYRGLTPEEKKNYFSWLFLKTIGFNPRLWKKKGLAFYNRRFVKAYTAKQRWIFISLAISFLYLGFSGFIFALFIPGRIRGVPLMLHMIAGGLFGMTLCAVVILRARCHKLGEINNPSTRSVFNPALVRISFWIFILSGFLLITSALAMMTSFFSLAAQLQLFSLHQYSALASVLAALAFIYFTPDETPA